MNRVDSELLEFGKLLAVVAEHAFGSSTRAEIAALSPLPSKDLIVSRQTQVSEIMDMHREGNPPRLSSFSDITFLLEKARPKGSVLDPVEIAAFIPVLDIATDIHDQFFENSDFPVMQSFLNNLTGYPDIRSILKRSVDSEGNILDTASALLSELRHDIRKLEARISKQLEALVRDEKVSVFLQDTFITRRSGRWVIPVRMDAKGQVSGIVHDVSKSGETAFVEPLAIIGLSNEFENLVAEEKAEEIRILKNISAVIRDNAEGILAEYRTISHVDLLNAIATLADRMNMKIPEINDKRTIRLVSARHPLLELAFMKDIRGQKVVPLELELGGDNSVMVITGSNAGGKTVAIKTIGILSMMALSGMPVPASDASSFPFIRQILADIGDEQSIENSLSTFSGHIENIAGILREADPETLVLIDEMGTGTDPEEGAALACAILKELVGRKPLVFATTHLADIKGFVHRTTGMINASMDFDDKTLTPLYRLRIGEPGQSHAIETAKRYGLPLSIIESAKALLGGIKVEFDNLVADLSRKRADYEKALNDLAVEKKIMSQRLSELDAKTAEAEAKRKEILARALQESSDLLLDTKRQMSTLMEVFQKEERARRRDIMREIEKKQSGVRERLKEYSEDRDMVDPETLSEGDIVFIRSLGYDARVVKIFADHNRLRVSAGGKEVELSFEDIAQKKGKKIMDKAPSRLLDAKGEMPVSRLNLIGLRVDEALAKLEPFLNHAALDGLNEVTVIHGYGTGALSRAVKEHLTGHPLVKNFRKGEPSEGGAGVTVITLT